MAIQFLYFDMGNVLLHFSHEKMAAQMAQVAGTNPALVWKILFEDGLEWAYERGELSREQFHGRFCEAVGVRADTAALERAGNEIFELNAPILGIVGRLAAAGYRLGVCSNTSPSHWDYCIGQFAALSNTFFVHALSFRLKAIKPDSAFYAAATKLTGVSPNQIFFTDDRSENVAAAAAAGWDAVLYESVSQLNEALRQRNILINY